MSGEDGKVIIGTELDTKDFDRELEHLQDQLNNLVDEYEVIKNSKPFEGQDEELAKLSKEINKTKKQMSALVIEKDKMEKANLRSVDFQLKNIGESIKEVTSKVAKWTLAVFGVRSAYMFVRNSISTIANADEQLKSDIDTMKAALAYTIEPLVRSIVNLAKQLMGYIAYIVKAWTGRDIFAQANKSLASANKSAKELQKSSASFDKFNKLSGSGAGAGGGGTMALKTPEDADAPKWVKWIAKNKDVVIGALVGIAGALLLIKLANPVTWIAIVIGLIAYLVIEIIKHWDEIKDILKTAGKFVLNFIEGIFQTLGSVIKFFISTITGIFTTLGNILITPFRILWETVSGVFNGIITAVRGVFEVIKGIFTGDWQVVMDGFKNIFKGTMNSLVSIIKAPINLIIDIINSLIKGANKISFDIPSWVPKVGGKKFGINIPTIPRLAKGGIVNMPGSGIVYNGASIGERGPEAIVPFTDNAQMELLGSSIGKHIKINATIINEIEGRVFGKVMKEINNENQFARNGG